MTSSEMLHADILDIVFDNRNKDYGAYQLRKHYEKRVWMAIGITFTVCGCISLLFAQEPQISMMVTEADAVVLTSLQLPEPIKKPEQPPAPKAPATPVAAEHFAGDIQIVEDSKLPPDDVVPPVDVLAGVAFGTEKEEGDMPVGHVAVDPPVLPATEPAAPKAEPAIMDASAAEESALFPGGAAAFARYLARQIGQPEGLEPGESLTAKLTFIVGKDGTVLDTEVLQSATAELDQVVLRALQRSPRWKPARNLGKEVAVRFTLPVTFVGTEE